MLTAPTPADPATAKPETVAALTPVDRALAIFHRVRCVADGCVSFHLSATEAVRNAHARVVAAAAKETPLTPSDTDAARQIYASEIDGELERHGR